MRTSFAFPARLLAIGAIALASSASPGLAQGLQVTSSDDRGITVRLDLPAWRLVADPASTGRQRVELPGFGVFGVPGRPLLPFASTLIALPPGAGARATVVAEDGETVTERVAMAIGGRTEWVRDRDLGIQPAIRDTAAVLDGPWPRGVVEIGTPFTVRHQTLVALRVLPFRYDEATGRLWAKRSVTVRVDFTGARAAARLAPAPDRRAERAFRGAVLNYEQGRSFRSAAAPVVPAPLALRPTPGVTAAAGTLAFDEDQPEVRVRVDSSAVYRLPYEQLAANGYPAGVAVSEVSVHRHEFLEDADPAYATIELPCEVDDADSDGLFGEGDAVIVYAQSWRDRARPSIWQRLWGDADYLYVTRLLARPGLRVATRPGWRGATGLTPLVSYPFTTRLERLTDDYRNYSQFLPDTTTDPYVWVPVLTYYDRPDSMRFSVSDLDTTQRVGFAVTFIGRQATTHFVWAATRNGLGQTSAVVDSAFFTGKTTVTYPTTVTGSALTEGFNRFLVWGKTLNAPPDPVTNFNDQTALDRFDLTYWRGFRALRGYLACNSAGASGVFQVHARGFSSTFVRAYDVTDSTAAVRLLVDPSQFTQTGFTWNLDFQDSTASAAAPRRYVVVELPREPAATAYSAVTRRDLAGAAGRPDYLLIVPEAFLPAVTPLADLRRAQGLDVLVAPYESIRDEFNGGRSSAWAIRRFLRYAYRQWDARFAVLVGDAAAEDPQNFWHEATLDWLPTMMVRSPIGVAVGNAFGLETVPADSWYGLCLDPACTDPSLQPKLHDLYVGRLPVNSLQEASDVVAKLVAYENVAAGQDWRSAMLLHADDMFSGETFGDLGSNTYCRQSGEAVFATLNQACRDVILNEAGLAQSNAELFDMNVWLANEPTYSPSPGVICRPDRAATQTRTRGSVSPELFSRLAAGRLWWNYQGHANENVLTHESIYETYGGIDDWRSIANDGKPFLFSAFSCHANNFGRLRENDPNSGPCIGEEFVRAPLRGAIASWASTGYEIIPNSGSQHINVELARALFSRVAHDDTVPDPRPDPYARVVLGEAVALALLRWYPQVIYDPTQRDVGLTYELLGDPATRIAIARPQSFVTVNGLPAVSAQPLRLHTPADTVRFEADLVSNQQIVALQLERQRAAVRDTLPAAAYTIAPAFPDSARGGTGGRRYHVTYRDTLAIQSYACTFRATDRSGVSSAFEVDLPFTTVLRSAGQTVNDGDAVPPGAALSLLVISPAPIPDPANQLTLTVNDANQPFTVTANPGDGSGREWILSWTGPMSVSQYAARLEVPGTGTFRIHKFSVTITGNELRLLNAMLFPNPFEDDLGAFFSFNLESGRPADVLIRVYTVSGRLVYRRSERGLAPGYHQLAWDGRDAEGDKLANGVYFYRLQASNGSQDVTQEGRIVKLRRPHREAPATP